MNTDLWIRRYHPVPGGSVRLLLLPHAGGSASFYRPLSAALAALPGAPVEPLAAQYPGRQDRHTEPPLTDVRLLARNVAAAAGGLLDRPLVLLGHSMGALVGFEVARLLEARGCGPALLVVSGRRPPGVPRTGDDIHLRSDAAVLAEVRALQGTRSPLLADEELIRMIMPALRADYQAVETYTYRDGPALACPIAAFVGDADPRVEVTDADGWAEHTRGGFTRQVFPGGHFYLVEQVAAVVAAIGAVLPEPVKG